MNRPCAGQAMAEYAVLIGVITAAMLGIQLYAKRGIEAGVKVAADQISPCVGDPCADDPQGEQAQAAGMSYETGDRTSRAFAIGGDQTAKPFAIGTVLANESGVNTRQAHTTTTAMSEGGSVTRTMAPGPDNKDTTVGVLTDRGPGVAQHSEVVVDRRR